MSHLDEILDQAEGALSAIAEEGGLISPQVAGISFIADRILRVVIAGVKAHETVTGEPLDMSKLHRIDPLPPETPTNPGDPSLPTPEPPPTPEPKDE